MSKPFTCEACGESFTVPEAALAKYPGWTPRECLRCRDEKGGGRKARGRGARRQSPAALTEQAAASIPPPDLDDPRLARVLERHQDGPATGIFTDGSASPNPGRGGWGVVWVEDGVILDQRRGEEPHSTNNRMELTAIIEAYRMVPEDREVTVYTDSNLAVRTINEWAAGWERRGWRRKGGEIKNLDLVKELHALAKGRPNVTLAWVPGHAGWRWNEYADALATQRDSG